MTIFSKLVVVLCWIYHFIIRCWKTWRMCYKYQLLERVKVQSSNALAFSLCGTVLSCGGDAGIDLWSIDNWKLVKLASPVFNTSEGYISVLAWARHGSANVLIYGTSLGYLALVRVKPEGVETTSKRQMGQGNEITCISYDSETSQFLLGYSDGIVQLWHLDNAGQPQNLFSSTVRQSIISAVGFSRGIGRDYHAITLNDGSWSVFNKEGKLISSRRLGKVIFGGTMYTNQNLIALYTRGEGIGMYEADNGNNVQTYTGGTASHSRTMMVVLGEGADVIVTGSETGRAYVYDRQNGSLLETLCHQKDGVVQTIATMTRSRKSIIAICSAEDTPKKTITIWGRKLNNERDSHKRLARQQYFWPTVTALTIALLLYQNLVDQDIITKLFRALRGVPSLLWQAHRYPEYRNPTILTLGHSTNTQNSWNQHRPPPETWRSVLQGLYPRFTPVMKGLAGRVWYFVKEEHVFQ